MSWRIESRDDEWCVIKESDGSVAGCHASRARALAQQRALYANEAETASANGPVRVEIAAAAPDVDQALVASIAAVTERLVATEETLGQIAVVLSQIVTDQAVDRTSFQDALTAAANRPAPEPPVVHVDVQVPEQAAPAVNVHVPKTKLIVPTPVVNVTLPSSKRTVKFERDPLTGQVSQAEIEES